MFRAGLSGTNWTGKTETIRRFVREHSELAIKTVSLTSLVDRCPFPMMEEQTVEASQWMIEQVGAMCTKDSAEMQLFDRTPVDILAFTLYAESRTGNGSPTVLEDALELVKYFDILFYVPVVDEWPVNTSASRSKIQFALKMDSYMRTVIEQFSLDVVSLPWDLAKRQSLLSEYFRAYKLSARTDDESVQ